MRTTVTLDADTEQLLRRAMQQTGQSFKVALNQAIRKGLAETEPSGMEAPFVVSPHAMKLRTGIDPAQLQQFGDELEVDSFLGTTRRLIQADKETP